MVHVNIEITRIGAGMLGEQGVGEVSRVEIKRRRRMKRRSKVPKIFFCLPQKQNKNQIDLPYLFTYKTHLVIRRTLNF